MCSTQLSEDTVKVEIIPESLQACRICLVFDVKLYDIQEWELGDMYSEVTGMSWSAWDALPQHVCAFCRAQLRRAQTVRSRAQRADVLLKQALVHQHFITNNYIRTIDRSMYKLTHTFSIATCKNYATYSYNDTHTENLYNNVCVIENKQINDMAENDLKEYDLTCDNSVKNDIQNSDIDDFGVEDDSDKFNSNDLDDKPNLADVKLVETLDSNIKKVRATKKRNRQRNEGKNKTEKRKEFSKQKSSIEEDFRRRNRQRNGGKNKTEKRKECSKQKSCIEEDFRRRNRQRNEGKNKTEKRKECSKQKFSTEEDFREFEKKYDFQVQCLTEEEMEREMKKRKESDKYLKGEYKCDLCYKGFLTLSTYDNHMKTHDPARGDNECRLCHLRYQFPVKLRQHVQNAHRLKFRCARCSELVRGKACAVLHAAYHAGTTFQCAHCDKRFLKKTSRTSHMRMAHPVENAAGGTCEACGETFTSRTGLKAHKTRSHKKANLPELRCRKCRIQFDNMDALKRHKEMQMDSKCDPSLSACEQCGESCASADDLILHKHTRHDVQLFTCDTCTKSFTSKASLATHIDRIHRRIRPPKADYSDGGRRKQPDWLHWASVCEHCGKRLSCLATLKIHMNKHTGERPYKCTLCPKAYMTPYGLNNHQAFHTGVRKWQCSECPATFVHQSSVYQHRKIHTGERSHQCTICDKYFTQSGSLYTHVKYVHMKETPPPRKRSKKPAVL